MLYEMRIYVPHDGKAAVMRARFLNRVLPIFARVGIDVVQVYAVEDGSDRLIYVIQYPNSAVRETQWAAFFADKEWATVKAETEMDGPLLESQDIIPLALLR